jgi:hypothetical protein
MACGSLLIWATGLEGLWRVDVRLGVTDIRGFREVSGPLRVKGESLLVTNYESLTMAAQFGDVRLPQGDEEDQLIRLPDGDYSCRIVQMFNPEADEHAGENLADFVIAISKPAELPPVWSEVPWFKA